MSARLPFYTLDVFTTLRFSGNPLAVVLQASDLATQAMQRIAAEFNLSETVFVTRLDRAAARASIRIFTPKAELPFAGHPTIGTALLLARQGIGQRVADGLDLVLDAAAGPVPVTIRLAAGQPEQARFTAPGTPTIGAPLEPAMVAPALGLEPADLTGIAPRRSGFGTGFLIVELASLEALASAGLTGTPAPLLVNGLDHGAYLFTRATGDGTIRARLFAPALGITEDPATGAAAAGLAALLASVAPAEDFDQAWRIEQGVEMGRPSTLDITATKRQGRLHEVTVAGGAVPVAEGWITV